MAAVENILTAGVTALAVLLAALSWRAWLHTRSTKILLLAAGFSVFTVKGLLLTVGLFTDPDWEQDLFVPSLLLDALALVLFYLAVLKRSAR